MVVRILVSLLMLFMFPVLSVQAEEKVFTAGISVIDQIPQNFFGTWRVKSVLISTDSPANFRKKNIDIWNLLRSGDVLILRNPFSGAEASVTLSYAENNSVCFTKTSNYEGKRLTDTVKIDIDGNTFSGENRILLETLSNVDNSVVKASEAIYTLRGEKIAE